MNKKLVPYTEYDIDNNKRYNISVAKRDSGFNRTMKNLKKMKDEGRVLKVISPSKELNDKEIEAYRRNFCKEAKERGLNIVYFIQPIRLTECGGNNE